MSNTTTPVIPSSGVSSSPFLHIQEAIKCVLKVLLFFPPDILYQRMIDVDEVDFFFAPLSQALASVLPLANANGIPIINGAIFEYVLSSS